MFCAAPVTAGTEPAFNPHSTEAEPCGLGVPLAGHVLPELRPSSQGITMTVRQDGSRLCYVVDGSADAPVIRVRQGSELTITLRNEIINPAAIDAITAPHRLNTMNPEVPQQAGFYKVISGTRHRATGATNLHVHGFAVPPVAPQDDVLMTCIDPAVGPAICGKRQFTYHYHVPANMPEGLYWYHPHVHGEVQAQMLMGLSGAIVVEGPEDDARRAAGIQDRILIVRQTQDVDAGKAQVAPMIAGLAALSGLKSLSGEPKEIDTAHELLCAANSGVDEISLNGTPVPVGDGPDSALARLEIPVGRKQLWRILNAATDAFLDLTILDQRGIPQPFEVIARDGAPLTDDLGRPRPVQVTDSQMVPPAGRIEILVAAPPAGVKAYLVTRAVDTGCAGDRLPERRLAVISASPATEPASFAAWPPPTAQPDFFTGLMSRKTDRQRVIALAEYPRPGAYDQTDFYIVERRPGAVLKPYKMGEQPAIIVEAGTTEEWVVENWTNELHAFHIHQVHFRLLEIDGVKVAEPPLLDVVTVPTATATGYQSREGPVRPGRVRIKLTFPEKLVGDIPFHCHLADHEDKGMMAVLRIVPPKRVPPKPSLIESLRTILQSDAPMPCCGPCKSDLRIAD